MPRSIAAVFGLALGFPILAMIAITATGGIKPDWLVMFLVSGVIMSVIVAAVFEIKRLADLDRNHHSEQPESARGEVLAAPQVIEITPPPLAVTSAADTSAAIPIPELPASAAENAPSAMPEPIVVAPVTEITAAPKAKSRPKSGQRKPTAAPVPDAQAMSAKSKRKSRQPKHAP